MARYQTLEVRFWSKVEKTEKCWNWVGAKNNNGYGQIFVDGKKPVAHRVSLSMVGPDRGRGCVTCRRAASLKYKRSRSEA